MIYEFPKKLLAEREETHGEFKKMAMYSQELKALLNTGNVDDPILAEGLEMICVKQARIAAGNPRFVGHWEDIAGYAIKIIQYLNEYPDAPPDDYEAA